MYYLSINIIVPTFSRFHRRFRLYNLMIVSPTRMNKVKFHKKLMGVLIEKYVFMDICNLQSKELFFLKHRWSPFLDISS